MMDGASTSLRTLRPIKKDEEIYISYIDATNPFHRRQSELKARWFFDCNCTKCEKGAVLDEDKWVQHPNTLPTKFQKIADTLLNHEKVAQDPSNYVGDTNEDLRVAALQGKAFAEYEEAQALQHPSKIVQKIEDAMHLCHQSGLWPVHRQPYAALRDDLIVNLLSLGRYPTAWAHCAKRYKYILPKLYPVPFHPIRIVQTWQMAGLAIYLAGTPEGVGAPGVNMGLIAMMLVKQVLDASALSHGKESAFAKSVGRKAEEMMEELKRSLGGRPDSAVMNAELEAQRDMLSQMGDLVKF
jgi:SET and MYND domain-containing protein